MNAARDIIIGVDAGTSVIKAVAFTLNGTQLADAARPNRYHDVAGGGVEQDAEQTWRETAATLGELATRVARLDARTAGVAVTGQGDGTWLIDDDGKPVMPSWLWLDARATDIVRRWRAGEVAAAIRRTSGTGVNPANQAVHLRWLQDNRPELLAAAATVFHCKDWLYFCLTGERVTDTTEAMLTFGDLRTGDYAEATLALTGLEACRRLLPPVVDSRSHWRALTPAAAKVTGLAPGTPVVLAPIDIECSGLGAGVYASGQSVGATTLGSTGAHMRCVHGLDEIGLDRGEPAGYAWPFVTPGTWLQVVSNMAASLNIDWFVGALRDLVKTWGPTAGQTDAALLSALDDRVAQAQPGRLIYHPFIYSNGERGPFVDPAARAQFLGLHTGISIVDMLRAVYEGMGFAARDCYQHMGAIPDEIRLTGGCARSRLCREILAAALDRPLRCAGREETGAAGAAMVATLALGHYGDLDRVCADWVTPYLGVRIAPDPALAARYDALFPVYRHGYQQMGDVWRELAAARRGFAS